MGIELAPSAVSESIGSALKATTSRGPERNGPAAALRAVRQGRGMHSRSDGTEMVSSEKEKPRPTHGRAKAPIIIPYGAEATF
jgi:hypothetical protein